MNETEQKNLVLIVEDDKSTAHTYVAILSRAGCDTLVAHSGQEADALLHETMPDLILLDLLFPDASVIDLLGKWRANHTLQDIPIMIVSSVSEVEIKVKGIEAGADDYLVKPVDPAELIARVKSLFARHDRQQKLRLAADLLFIQSATDVLTGLYNRRYLKSVLEREIAIFVRYGLTFSLMVLDIDNFKDINDTYGHPVGDSIILAVGKIINEQTRKSDVVTRYGGDEFIVLLNNTNMQECFDVAENMRVFIENCRLPEIGGRQVTISIGVAECRPDDDMNRIIKRADDALYAAKRQGRNRTQGS